MQSSNIVDVTAETFAAEVLQRSTEVPVLVDFWADWCNPCHMLMPILTKITEEAAGALVLARVNADQEQMLAMQAGVRSLPNVKLFRDGRIVDEFTGALPESQVRAFLGPHVALNAPADEEPSAARVVADAGSLEQALAQAEAAHNEEPDDHRATIGYAELLVQAGRYDDADALLQNMPADEQTEEDTLRLAARISFARCAAQSPPLAQLEQAIAADPADHDARYAAAAHEVMNDNLEQAMAYLFAIFQQDRRFRDGAAHQALLSVFRLAGDLPAVSDYRRRLAALLY